jgi:hypothetical protein
MALTNSRLPLSNAGWSGRNEECSPSSTGFLRSRSLSERARLWGFATCAKQWSKLKPPAQGQDLRQSARHHDVLQEIDHRLPIGSDRRNDVRPACSRRPSKVLVLCESSDREYLKPRYGLAQRPGSHHSAEAPTERISSTRVSVSRIRGTLRKRYRPSPGTWAAPKVIGAPTHRRQY